MKSRPPDFMENKSYSDFRDVVLRQDIASVGLIM